VDDYKASFTVADTFEELIGWKISMIINANLSV
jgi:hypothetical protein